MRRNRFSLANFLAKASFALMLAVSASLPSAALANAPSSWLGYNGDDPVMWLAVTPTDIRIEAPTPLAGNNLQLLLALPGNNGGLGEMREEANREFGEYLNRQVQQQFGEFFNDERVRLVDTAAPLTLQIKFYVKIRQKILDIVNGDDFDLEKGTMVPYGHFQYRVLGASREAPALREGVIDLSQLKLKARYRTRAPKDGGVVEGTTREATESLLADLAEEVLDRVEDDLEADALLALAWR